MIVIGLVALYLLSIFGVCLLTVMILEVFI